MIDMSSVVTFLSLFLIRNVLVNCFYQHTDWSCLPYPVRTVIDLIRRHSPLQPVLCYNQRPRCAEGSRKAAQSPVVDIETGDARVTGGY